MTLALCTTFCSELWTNCEVWLFDEHEPSPAVVANILQHRSLINTPYSDDYEHMLKETFQLCEMQGAGYVRTGECWSDVGFQRDDPASDLRGGGILALANLNFFLRHPRVLALSMIERRKERDAENYPWAAAGINVTRFIATTFQLITPSGSSAVGPYAKKSYWHMLAEPDGFSRLYVCCFVLLDTIFDEIQAQYMDFPKVVRLTQARFLEMLETSKSLGELESRFSFSLFSGHQ